MGQLKLSDMELERRISSFLERKMISTSQQRTTKQKDDQRYTKTASWKQYAL